MSDTNGRTIEERAHDAACSVAQEVQRVCDESKGGKGILDLTPFIQREFADIPETDPRVVALVEALKSIRHDYPERGALCGSRCPGCIANAALAAFNK